MIILTKHDVHQAVRLLQELQTLEDADSLTYGLIDELKEAIQFYQSLNQNVFGGYSQ